MSAALIDGRLSTRLRVELRECHEELEQALGLPASVAGADDYARLLSLWTTVWTTVAALAAVRAPRHPGLDPVLREDIRRSDVGIELAAMASDAGSALGQDIADLGRPDLAAAPSRTPLAVPAGEAPLWGVTYVLRGSALGNRVLRPLLLRRLDGTPASAFRYLAGEGDRTRRTWVDFCARLDGWADRRPPEDRTATVAATVAAAAATFAYVGAVADAVGWQAVHRAR